MNERNYQGVAVMTDVCLSEMGLAIEYLINYIKYKDEKELKQASKAISLSSTAHNQLRKYVEKVVKKGE